MKKLIVSQLLLLMMSAFFFSCSKKDSDTTPPILLPKLDGLYIYGTNTIADGPTDPNARMSLAVLDYTKGPKINTADSVYGKFLYIGANSTISLANVVDEVGKTYGLDNGGATDSASAVANVAVKDVIIHGTIKENGAAIKVTDEGLYYAYVDLNTMTFLMMKVRANMIGDATPNDWAKGTFLQPVLLTKDSSAFEGTGIALKDGHGYRYRFNDGWALYQSDDITLYNSLGVLSYADAWAAGVNDLTYNADNIPHHNNGVFNVHLKYVAATGKWTESFKKTGDIPIDYSIVHLAIEGNAYVDAAGDTGAFAGAGADYYDVLQLPTVSGTTFTWKWTNAKLIQGREFILLQDGTWGAGFQIDHTGAALSGDAIDDGNIVDAKTVGGAYDNFFVVDGVDKDGKGNTYDLTFTFDKSTGGQTLNIKKHVG